MNVDLAPYPEHNFSHLKSKKISETVEETNEFGERITLIRVKEYEYGFLRSIRYHDYKSISLHKINGPAEIIYNATTNKLLHMTWLRYGVVHRDDGPAIVFYNSKENYNDESGTIGNRYSHVIYAEQWMHHGTKHRSNGPSYINYFNEWNNRYEINGKDVTLKVREWIKDFDIPHWSKWGPEEIVLFHIVCY